MKEPEYKEGPEVAERFEEAMKTLFRTPKPEAEEKRPKKAASPRKPKKSDRD
jgi:hypothetical protein